MFVLSNSHWFTPSLYGADDPQLRDVLVMQDFLTLLNSKLTDGVVGVVGILRKTPTLDGFILPPNTDSAAYLLAGEPTTLSDAKPLEFGLLSVTYDLDSTPMVKGVRLSLERGDEYVKMYVGVFDHDILK